jgi:hypothetical protein
LLRFVANDVRQRDLGYFAREAGYVSGPIAEAGTETVNTGVLDLTHSL